VAAAGRTTQAGLKLLTLAVRLETHVITGDDRFARRLAKHPLLAPHIRSVEDFVSE
jgi:hypothetical protein